MGRKPNFIDFVTDCASVAGKDVPVTVPLVMRNGTDIDHVNKDQLVP